MYVLAPGFVVEKESEQLEKNTSLIREPGRLNVTVLISDIAKFGTREERGREFSQNINHRGPQ